MEGALAGRHPRRITLGLCAPLLLLYGLALLFPLLATLEASVGSPPSLDFLSKATSSQGYRPIFVRTLTIAFWTTVWTVGLALPVAAFIARASARGQRFMLAIVLFSAGIPVVIRTFGWMAWLQRTGIVNSVLVWLGFEPADLMFNAFGNYVGLIHVFLPFAILPIYASLAEIDPKLSWAALSLGASPTRHFATVTLPLILPSVLLGGAMVFVLSLGAFITPRLLGGRTEVMVAVVIEDLIRLGQKNTSAALAVTLTAVCLVSLGLARRVVGARPS
ncbi:ABC transporter permease [Planctomycetota bacterium]|nr:ABC transporter permease [Planctomycetota bacterium]